MLDAIQDAFAPYVKDRGLDWEIHIEQVMTYHLPSTPKSALLQVACMRGRMTEDLWGNKPMPLAKILCI